MAVYRPNDPRDYMEIMNMINDARDNDKELEIKKYRKSRTSNQRKYLHFLIRWVASEYGCTSTYMKEFYLKQVIAPFIFDTGNVDRAGNKVFRSESTLKVDEECNVIQCLRDWAALGNIETPDANDRMEILYCEKQIEKQTSFGI